MNHTDYSKVGTILLYRVLLCVLFSCFDRYHKKQTTKKVPQVAFQISQQSNMKKGPLNRTQGTHFKSSRGLLLVKSISAQVLFAQKKSSSLGNRVHFLQ